jgi:hypothetical protein
MFALRVDEAAAIDDYDELRKRIVAAYKELEQDCEFVVCEGTDFAGLCACPRFAEAADELHHAAERLGLRREWKAITWRELVDRSSDFVTAGRRRGE